MFVVFCQTYKLKSANSYFKLSAPTSELGEGELALASGWGATLDEKDIGPFLKV